VYFPNIISPNGDGENERFTLFGRNVAEIELLQIYNRWGALVYEKNGLLFNDELDGWDGRVKGEPPLPGVYVWQARIRYSDGVVDWFKGDVTVIR
jgi:gliding motility-associated-like protein